MVHIYTSEYRLWTQTNESLPYQNTCSGVAKQISALTQLLTVCTDSCDLVKLQLDSSLKWVYLNCT